MTKFIITVIVLLALLAGAIVMLDNVNVVKPTPTPTAAMSATPVVTDYGTMGNIKVSTPKAAEEIGLPAVIKGEARTFEASFAFRIKDAKGGILREGHGMSSGTAEYPEFRPFEVSANYLEPKNATGSIEVFEISAKDGTEINKVVVPVMFKKDVAGMTTKLYLTKEVATNWRIPKSDTPIRATLEELVKVLNMNLVFNSVSLKSRVLTVDLKSAATADQQQLMTLTAKQNTSVKSVIFTINGKSS